MSELLHIFALVLLAEDPPYCRKRVTKARYTQLFQALVKLGGFYAALAVQHGFIHKFGSEPEFFRELNNYGLLGVR